MTVGELIVRAVDTAYAKLGESASYEPRDALAFPVRVIHREVPNDDQGFSGGARQTVVTIRVRKREVADPRRGDLLTTVDGVCLSVQDSRPYSRWEWELDVK